MLKIINNQSVFYVVCPANLATGGPELLHQLAYELKSNGKKVFMYYLNSKTKDPVHEYYKEYKLEYVNSVEDSTDSVIIFPEVYTEKMLLFNKAKKIIWWLSVDNYFISRPHVMGRLNRMILDKFNSQNFLFFSGIIGKADFHLVQSFYAADLLKRKNILNYAFLSDYLHSSFLKETVDVDQKEDIVAYNPKKGTAFTKMLIDSLNEINFVPIQNMTRSEVVSLLKRAKVYIDFGNHPGKDRIPREAAFLNCCVITGKEGSANFYQDVPIKSCYKFDKEKASVKEISLTILSCFDDFTHHNLQFESYRSEIIKEQKKFKEAVVELFVS